MILRENGGAVMADFPVAPPGGGCGPRLRHDGAEHGIAFARYTIATITDYSALAPECSARIVRDLALGMPIFDVPEYFGNQPGIFANYDFLTVAHAGDTGLAIGLIGARWMQAGGQRLLYVWTAVLADAYRSTKLYSRMMALTIAAVLRGSGGVLPDLIATKTYNPRVFALVTKHFERVPGVTVYPRIPGPQAADMRALAGGLAAALWPAMPFDPDTAVLRGGQASVSPNFYPRMEPCRHPAITAHFAANLTRRDQIVCLMRVPPAASAHIAASVRRTCAGGTAWT